MKYEQPYCPHNVFKGTTPEGYSNAESTKTCAGKQIDRTLAAKYVAVGDYRLARGDVVHPFKKI